MAEIKTRQTTQSVKDFLNTIEPADKRADGFTLLELFQKVTGEEPVMWRTSIVGFGKYHYKSEKSTQEGDWLLTGFSPRKQNLTLYIMHGNEDSQDLLSKLGKHKTSVGMGGCLYINHLSDVDITILEKLIQRSFAFMNKRWQ
jgi:hypothetical protein